MTCLTLTNVHVPIGSRTVLRDISFRASGGEFIGLVGPNGAGKSTLAKALASLLPTSSGSININGQCLTQFSPKDSAKNIAYLAQGDIVHWPLSARSIVALGRRPHIDAFGSPSRADQAAVDRAMQRAFVGEFTDRDVTQLSGGERARVLLARALAVEAPIFIADEPVGALDPRHGLNIMALLREEANRGVLVITVIHDLALATRYCDRLIALRDGELADDGPPHQVLSPRGMAAHYAVEGHHAAHDGQAFVLPWRPL
ncbi:ABC transporter ATP-binding protein [Sphingopyxis yananensis]|uniref:ABC transporter ATP-binding protein n=1 Tax=Sphingopyxis yananensis TaxID=2886687 RepID=UPI001D0F978F|nr:ABC transporter ATP-binding protein [Sphingopyxis yananensis]MCC2603602.1 ABC transporter ATP-binding protein [Sphingopyxis yananensis]